MTEHMHFTELVSCLLLAERNGLDPMLVILVRTLAVINVFFQAYT